MFVRIKSTPNSPRKSIQIVESIRDGDKVRQKILRHVGIAEDEDELIKLKELAEYIKTKLEAEHQPSLFTPEEVAKQVLQSQSSKKAASQAALSVDLKQLQEEQRVVMGIHDVYGCLFDELGFDSVIGNAKRNQTAADIFRHIVLARIANPDSKRASVAMLEKDFAVSLPLEKVYRMMDKLDDVVIKKIKDRAHQGTQELFKASINVMFFDCTTLYFESFTEGELQANGYSKDCKFNQPQVLLALLVTTDGLPIGYEVFPGSTFEGHTLKKVLDDLKADYQLHDAVFVADRGMLSRDNLSYLDDHNINYIVGGKLKALPAIKKTEVLAQKDYLMQATEDEPRSYEFHQDGRRWVMVYNAVRAEKDRKDREKAIEKLAKKIGKSRDPKALLNNYGYKKYLKVEGKTDLTIDQDKVEADAQWDGLQAVVTSLQDAPAETVFGHYRGLWQVEESFRITKHDLKVRPIYHWTEKRIKAHLAISFTAFSLVRLLSFRVKLQYTKLSPAVIRNALVHIQQSVLIHKQTGERYCIPSNTSPEAEKIYRLMDLDLSRIPFKLSA